MRGLRGGFGGAGSREFSNQDIYAPYPGPEGQAPAPGGREMYGFGGAGPGQAQGSYPAAPAFDGEPSQQIMVRNVCCVVLHSATISLTTL